METIIILGGMAICTFLAWRFLTGRIAFLDSNLVGKIIKFILSLALAPLLAVLYIISFFLKF